MGSAAALSTVVISNGHCNSFELAPKIKQLINSVCFKNRAPPDPKASEAKEKEKTIKLKLEAIDQYWLVEVLPSIYQSAPFRGLYNKLAITS